MIDCRAVSAYQFAPDDRIFLDTNVWLYCLAKHLRSDEHQEKIATYSHALSCIKKAGGSIFTNLHVIVEFINCYAKESFKQWRHAVKESSDMEIKAIAKGKFKQFRNSQHFLPIANNIKDRIEEMLDDIADEYIGDNLSVSNLARLMENYATGTIDFNDLIFVEICKHNGLLLITDDADFKCHGITVLTANEHLLRDSNNI